MLREFHNRYLFVFDLFLLPLALYLSYVLRLEQFDLTQQWPTFMVSLLAIISFSLPLFIRAGIYARYWPYASVGDLLLLTVTVAISALAFGWVAILSHLIPWPVAAIPRTIPGIFAMTAFLGMALPRLGLRFLGHEQWRRRPQTNATAVVIFGAGEAGILLLRELQRNPHLGLKVVGFLDDDPSKQGLHIQGMPVLGDRHALSMVVSRYGVKQAIIAMPTAAGKEIRHIRQLCAAAQIESKTIPGIYELVGGHVSIKQIRELRIEDLLRRAPVHTDVSAVQALVEGKRVLVTGGGGSIGSELCRQIWRCNPAELVLVGHGENSIFHIYHELQETKREDHHTSILNAVIADIRFPDRIQHVFQEVQPQIVFHAAAHKHVPLMEMNPAEAVTNNILGTQHLLQAAMAVDVEHFVMISSDKAVNPTSIMGASKRVAEMLVLQAAGKTGKPYVAVRFGNVLGSRGSVVHTFRRQIEAGGPVTVTDPEMTRYFMTIPEAVQLVLQAAVLGRGGEIFMLEMGDPIKIVDLARDLIELSGKEVDTEIEIVYSGLRPGEKLYEELFVKGEEYHPTRHQKIFIARNASLAFDPNLDGTVHLMKIAADRDDRQAIRRALQSLIPEGRLIVEKRHLPAPQVIGEEERGVAGEWGAGELVAPEPA